MGQLLTGVDGAGDPHVLRANDGQRTTDN